LKTTVLEPESWKRVIEFEIPEAELSENIEKKLNEYKREAKLPGFRQGKVPLNVIKQRFGDAAKAAYRYFSFCIKDKYGDIEPSGRFADILRNLLHNAENQFNA